MRKHGKVDTDHRAIVSALELRIPRRLESPNKSRGAHWRVRHRISKDWEREIGWARVIQGKSDAMYLATGKMRVEIERHVPSGHNFIHDADNLAFSSKPILDSLKRLGYIKNDSRKWLEHPTPTQHVSADGKDWTVIRISRAEDVLAVTGGRA